MTTIDEQTLEAFRFFNAQNMKDLGMSSFLVNFLMSKNVYSLAEFNVDKKCDMSSYTTKVTDSLDFAGIELLAPFCETLTFPINIASAVGTAMLAKVNLTNFVKLKTLIGNNPNIQYFTGDISGLTTLEKIDITGDGSGKSLVLPRLSMNPNLKYVKYNGSGFPASNIGVNITNTGGLHNNPQLIEFVGVSWGAANIATTRPLVDNIFSTLRIQKVNGGAITKIDFTNSPLPTGGNANVDYTALVAAGVVVSLGNV